MFALGCASGCLPWGHLRFEDLARFFGVSVCQCFILEARQNASLPKHRSTAFLSLKHRLLREKTPRH